MAKVQILTTVEDVIEALGGVPAVAALTGRRPTAVYNWRWLGKFSRPTYKVMTEALQEKGALAPPRLWRMEGTLDLVA